MACEKQGMLAQVPGSLYQFGEMNEVPGFGLTHPQLLQPSGERAIGWNISQSLLSVTLTFSIHKYVFLKIFLWRPMLWHSAKLPPVVPAYHRGAGLSPDCSTLDLGSYYFWKAVEEMPVGAPAPSGRLKRISWLKTSPALAAIWGVS